MTPFSKVYSITPKTLIRFLDPQVVEFINAKSESPNLWVDIETQPPTVQS